MNVGEINKGVVFLLVLLLFGAGGYLWYSRMYTPAVTAKATAETAATTAEGQLATAKQQLEQAQQQVEASKKEIAKLDDSVARLTKARTAIPDRKLIDDAAITLVEHATRSGVQTTFKAGSEGGDIAADASATGGGGLDGATPIDIEFEAAGTYDEMMQFMQLVESSVERKQGKLYTRGRLFNVVQLKIGEESETGSGGGGGFAEEAEDDTGFILGPNDIVFTVTVRMYTSSTSNAAAVGETTPDPAAAATDPAAAGTDPASTGADPAAAGGASGTDPAASGATTDPAAGGGAADPAAAANGASDPAAAPAAATGGTT